MPNDKKRLIDLDLNGNEIQNAVVQNLATAPSNPKAGQFYFNTTDKTLYVYANGSWVNALVQGATYTEGTGIDITGTTISIDTSVVAQKSDLPTKLSDLTDDTATNPIDKADTLTGLTASITELNYVDGVTSAIQTQLNNKLETSLKGANSGLAELDANGKVPTAQLPSFVDDVVDAYIVSGATALSSGWLSATDGGSALTPETGKIYVVLSSGSYQNKTYRWSGTTYVEISASPAQATESAAGIAEIATQSETNTGTDDTRIVTPKKLASYTNGMTKKITAQNGALTASSGVCTWSITNSLGTADVHVVVKEVSSGDEVVVGVNATASTITITMNSASNISADTYRAIIIG